MIICNKCRTKIVPKEDDLCEECNFALDNPYIENRMTPVLKMPTELFKRYSELAEQVKQEKKGALTLLGKFMKALKHPFRHPESQAEINNPRPLTINVDPSTRDRIGQIIRHNLAIYAEKHQLETEEEANDFSVTDLMSDQFEHSIYQLITMAPFEEESVIKKVKTNLGPSGLEDPISEEEEEQDATADSHDSETEG